jgi:hypothetical protein
MESFFRRYSVMVVWVSIASYAKLLKVACAISLSEDPMTQLSKNSVGKNLPIASAWVLMINRVFIDVISYIFIA